MKVKMTPTNLAIVAMLVVAAIATAFWMLALSPKREEASKLGKQVEQLEASLAQHEAEVATAEQARESFPVAYRKLVVLGKAVPGDDDTASLLVQVNRIANHAGVKFRDLQLSASSGTQEAGAPASTLGAEPISATEAEAALLPLGAGIGPAGLAVMPYTLSIDGDFFEVADFIKGLDALVGTKDGEVAVDGRLMTVDGFTLAPDPNSGFPALTATFAVTTYLTPPSQGVTGGATSESPTAVPAATTTGGAP
jgi:Tfp pilus assembly protein PilO